MARKRRLITGRPVMITGAASGIGRSLAQRLSGSGSAVAITDIDEAGLKDTAKSLPGPVLMRVLDVRDGAYQHRFAAQVREWLTAPLAAVFNDAGVAVASSVIDADPGDDEWLRQINFDGVVNARDVIGGTWDLFRYPGVRSDSDMHTLGYRFRPWTQAEAIADGASILSYVRDTAAEA